MASFPLAHVSWAIADNADRKPVDAFFQNVFGARTAYEMLVTPEAEAMGLDREESLLMIGDTMLIPIAPAGAGAREGNPLGDMLRRSAAAHRWIGLALRVADIAQAAAWFQARGFTLHFDPGMETIYFLVSRGQALGMRLELLAQDLPGDPRTSDSGVAAVQDNPLGIEGLQSVGVSVPTLEDARALFGGSLELPELGERRLGYEDADCLAFNLGDTVIEAMAPRRDDSSLARHACEVKGICSLTFKVRDAKVAAAWLRDKRLPLVGDVENRFAIDPAHAHGRLIWLTGNAVRGYPRLGSRLSETATMPLRGNA